MPFRLSQLSIKTRIETSLGDRFHRLHLCCLSQLSIKTRIETKPVGTWANGYRPVWVSYPLKQGLKQLHTSLWVYDRDGLSQLSIKTRIETKNVRAERASDRGCLSQLSIKTRIETSIPAKRHLLHAFCLSQLSIKTRIETKLLDMNAPANCGFESAIH